ncbi:MAG: LLM class flavin-dependent oxidoreductase [Armatimonadota bacterium]|nr:LLM class flavin-dependent oxidoreductase [Armatimonadota bacterium]MDR7484715.1 LLM class flavin-dependent oxidoreductase [Armatimonadota bacterium]MDR7531830.1 LLM class flavin-dependent oxidoreductase [Armatimonadota bacterium]MDR7534825.1 LLM class flavin-dependent oxidoreductase [Armatimonadota bacterium]
MQVGIGLPSGIPGAPGELLLTWAQRADAGPFSSLGVIDRMPYDSFEPLVTLGAAAAVTRRVQLATMIVVAPLRNTALLAKSLASLDALSGGRLVVGVGVGARHEDYAVTGVAHRHRGRVLSEQLATLRTLWEGSPVVPRALRPQGPPLLVGGLTDEAFARAARYADGYVHGGGPPRAFARAADRARAAWIDAGRPGEPRLWGQGYFALGDDATIEAGIRYMKDYYAFTGPFAERIAAALLTTPQAVVQFLRGYADAGCHELVLFPAVAELTQLARLADIVA